MKRIVRLLVAVIVVCVVGLVFTACSDDNNDAASLGYGSVSGVISDDYNSPLEGVELSIGDNTVATTNAQGEFSIDKLEIAKTILTLKKTDYRTASVTLTPKSYTAGKAVVNACLVYAAAKIKGKVINAKDNDNPLAGARVALSESQYVETGTDGTFEIDNLPLDNYTVTFSYSDYTSISRSITVDDFVDGVATLEVVMGSEEILPGLTIYDLRDADHWYFNEYRGGRNAESYPHWDWSTDYLATFAFHGWWEEQNEGTTIQIRNREEDGDWKNPADQDNFDSFTYGLKHITADNAIMTIQCRTHNTDASNPAYWGVQVVDMSAASPKPEKVGENRVLDRTDGSYASEVFDLSKYIGKDVIIAIGLYRVETGDYYKQLVLRRIAFNTTPLSEGNWGWLSGTAIDELDGWALTQEMVRSTMPQTRWSFSGLSPVSGSRDAYSDAYQSWRTNNNIGYLWSFVPLHKDPEPFAGEGFVIKTNGSGTAVSLTEPQAYFYAKFAIDAAHSHFILKARNFSDDNATYFGITAIDDDMNVSRLMPSKVSADSWKDAGSGCISFVHNMGGSGSPDSYGQFEYDLSSYIGKNVTLVLSIFKGTDNSDENKLAIYSINLN